MDPCRQLFYSAGHCPSATKKGHELSVGDKEGNEFSVGEKKGNELSVGEKRENRAGCKRNLWLVYTTMRAHNGTECALRCTMFTTRAFPLDPVLRNHFCFHP